VADFFQKPSRRGRFSAVIDISLIYCGRHPNRVFAVSADGIAEDKVRR
jgi:hypothetical protein